MSSQVKVEIISSIQFPTAQPNVKRKTRDQFRQDLGNIGALVQALGCSFFWPTCYVSSSSTNKWVIHAYLILLESHRFCNRVQDAYTLRCCPQVRGFTLRFLSHFHWIISRFIIAMIHK